jgi:hypothetical protein
MSESTVSKSAVFGPSAAAAGKRSARRVWHYTPELPVVQAPYFERPFSLGASLRYLIDVWRPFNQRFLILMVAIVAWTWFTPSLERAREFQLDWMLEIGLRNLVIVLVVAGGLHLLLYTRSGITCSGHWSVRCRSAHCGNACCCGAMPMVMRR